MGLYHIYIGAHRKTNKNQGGNINKMDIEGYEEKAYHCIRGIIHSRPDITGFLELTRHNNQFARPNSDKWLL